MKTIWLSKLKASKAVEVNPEPQEPQPPQIVVNNPKPSKAAAAKAKKAAAAAAAAAAQQNNSSQVVATTSGDSKPNTSGSVITPTAPSTSVSANTTVANGSIKQDPSRPLSTNPPPLHHINSSGGNTIMQQKPILGQHQQQNSGITSSSQQQMQSMQAPSSLPIVAQLDPNRIMPVNITLPAQPGAMNSESRVLTIHVPASALQENRLTQILTAQMISSIMTLPTTFASSVLQQHVNAALANANMQKNLNTSKQLDGALDTSDEEESEESDDNIDNDDEDDIDKDDDDDIEMEGVAEEEPLNSEDDVTDEDAGDQFDTDNVIVCQYDKITRSRNKWKFYLKDGIMNIGGKDYIFQKSNGDAEW